MKKAAEKRQLLEQAIADVELWGGRRDVHPAAALLALVQSKAAEVAYFETRVASLADHEDVPASVELAALREAQRDLAAFSAASLKAGVELAMVELAQQQAQQLVQVLRAALSDSRVTVAPGVVDLVLRDAISSAVPTAP